MKILIVNKFLYPNGGSETYIFKLGEELKRQGHEVEYFGMEHEGRIVGNSVNEYTSNMDFHTGKLKKLLYPFKIIYSKEAYNKITKVIDKFRPDIVHLNNFNFQITPSVIYAVKNWNKKNKVNIKIAYTAHDYQWICPNHMMMLPNTGTICNKCLGAKFGECAKNNCIHGSKVKSLLGTIEAKLYYSKRTYELVDYIICPSEFLRKQLETYRGLSDKLYTMHNFIDKCDMDVNKENYVLYFGRYAKEKGVETLINVCRETPDIKYMFAGGGPLLEEVNNAHNIENVGFLQGDELKELIAKAKLTVFPSEWYENCPFTVMESQMYGTPVIASNIGGVPELIKDMVTGELFTPGDANELKEKICSLLNDDDRLKRYTDNCRNVKFDSVEEYTKKFISLVD